MSDEEEAMKKFVTQFMIAAMVFAGVTGATLAILLCWILWEMKG